MRNRMHSPEVWNAHERDSKRLLTASKTRSKLSTDSVNYRLIASSLMWTNSLMWTGNCLVWPKLYYKCTHHFTPHLMTWTDRCGLLNHVWKIDWLRDLAAYFIHYPFFLVGSFYCSLCHSGWQCRGFDCQRKRGLFWSQSTVHVCNPFSDSSVSAWCR